MYNRTLDMEGVGKMTDGIQCFDESRIRLRATLFADSLHGGVRLFNKAEGVISNCTFANFEVFPPETLATGVATVGPRAPAARVLQ